MLASSEYVQLRDRPQGRFLMYQNWRDLLFLHFSADPDQIQKILPEGLTVDTFPNEAGEECAWVGLVPFRMEAIRFRNGPLMGRLSHFPETNVRTYVHRNGHRPGVWFFSLDAARALACSYARAVYKLPYHFADMRVARPPGDRIIYFSRRKASKTEVRIVADIGPALPTATPGSLDFFLIERYLLYSVRGQRLHSGQVVHPPYSTRSASVFACNQDVVEACGIVSQPWEHICFCDGVDVEVFPLKRTSGSKNP